MNEREEQRAFVVAHTHQLSGDVNEMVRPKTLAEQDLEATVRRLARIEKEFKHGSFVVEANSALKYDDGKPPIGMIPRSALVAEAQVMAYGAKRYARDNWRKGTHYTRLIDAALRHITAYNEGEDVDPESGLSHLAHARCDLAFLIEYAEKKVGTDDRPKFIQNRMENPNANAERPKN